MLGRIVIREYLSRSGRQQFYSKKNNHLAGFLRQKGRKVSAAPQGISCNREPADSERYGGVVFTERVCFLKRVAGYRDLRLGRCSRSGVRKKRYTGCRPGGGFRSHSENAESEGLCIGNDRTSTGIRWKNPDERAASERSRSYQDVLT
jgi:hypothetical protein